MLNIRELEKRWLKYKIKSSLPYVVIVISLIIIITLLYFFLGTSTIVKPKESKTTKKIDKVVVQEVNKSTNTPMQAQPPKTIKASTATTINKVPLSPTKTLNNKDNALILQPSMGFMRHIQSEEQQPYYQTLHPVHKKVKKVKKKKRHIKKSTPPVQEEYMDIDNEQSAAPKKVEDSTPKKQVITIERRDSQKDIQDIIARFKNNNNPALSLFVAKKSYEIGDYKQAYNYALITNGINHNIEESWIIFAKALVKLHRKDMAIKTLREYIKYSHSGNAKILLNDITSGKFQ